MKKTPLQTPSRRTFLKGLTAAVPIQSVCVYERFVICHVRLPRVAASPNVEEYSPTPALTDRAFWKIAQITARHMERAGGHAFPVSGSFDGEPDDFIDMTVSVRSPRLA